MVRFLDLCSGLGGFHLGLSIGNGMAECVLASDIDLHARAIYSYNFPKTTIMGDMTELTKDNLPHHDILCAGFPCQPFSVAGRKEGFLHTKGNTILEILRIARIHNTHTLFLENVDFLLKHDQGRTFRYIVELLERVGYKVSWSVLSAQDFGLAQNRKRLFIIANKSKLFDFSKICHHQNRNNIASVIENNRPSNYTLKASEYTINPNKFWKTQHSGLIFVGFRNKNKRTKGAENSSLLLSRSHKQPNRIYHVNGIHPTLSAGESSGRYFVYNGDSVFKLTVRECFRLQGFPDTYNFLGSQSNLYKRIGNSVPINIITEIYNELIKQELV